MPRIFDNIELVILLHEEDRLCVPHDDVEAREPRIICSLEIAIAIGIEIDEKRLNSIPIPIPIAISTEAGCQNRIATDRCMSI